MWNAFGEDTYVPEEQDMGTPEAWREVARDPAKFEELRRAFGLDPKDNEPEQPRRKDVPIEPISFAEKPSHPGEPVLPVPVHIIERPVPGPERVVFIHPQAPATPMVPGPKPPIWNVREPEPRKTIPPDAQNNSETIPKNSQRIPNNSESVPQPAQIPPDAQDDAPMLQMPEVEKEGDVGRKRKNEDTGIYGDISVRQVILFRHIKGRHFPGLSADMKTWYEHFYFKLPNVGEKPYRGRDYEQHKRAYERGREWIAEHEASTTRADAVGNSGASIVPFPRRANS